MIFMLIIQVLISLVQLILGILPNAPATPSVIVSGGSWVTTQIGDVIAVLNYVFTSTLVAAVMIVVIALFTWDYIYHATLWLVRKIPFINIH